MLTAAEIAGFIGCGLAGAAYLPQIWHLVKEHCSAGISRVAFCVWLLASLLVTTHAVAIRAGVFILLGAVQIVATTLILLYATKYATSYCVSQAPGHPGAETTPRVVVVVDGSPRRVEESTRQRAVLPAAARVGGLAVPDGRPH